MTILDKSPLPSSTPEFTIQHSPYIHFLCLTQWFLTCVSPLQDHFVSMQQLYEHYKHWVLQSNNWTQASVYDLSTFGKRLQILIHARGWVYSREKREGQRGYYGVLINRSI